MANGIATGNLVGNLTDEPKLISDKLLTFSIAVNRREKDATGDYSDAPHYFDVKVLGNRAKGLHGILAKGRGVSILGDLVQERFERKDGTKGSAVRIIAREVVAHYGDGSSPAADGAAPAASESSSVPF